MYENVIKSSSCKTLRNWVVKLSRLSCCITMCRLPVQTPLRAFKGLGSLPCYEAAKDHLVQNQ